MKNSDAQLQSIKTLSNPERKLKKRPLLPSRPPFSPLILLFFPSFLSPLICPLSSLFFYLSPHLSPIILCLSSPYLSLSPLPSPLSPLFLSVILYLIPLLSFLPFHQSLISPLSIPPFHLSSLISPSSVPLFHLYPLFFLSTVFSLLFSPPSPLSSPPCFFSSLSSLLFSLLSFLLFSLLSCFYYLIHILLFLL